MHHLNQLLYRMTRYNPRPSPLRHGARQAAVAIVLRDGRQGIEVLLIKRATRAGDPWSGDMAFPGGKREPGDVDNCAAARRETAEETGLLLDARDCAGRLRERLTLDHGRRRHMRISPFVFRLPGDATLWRYSHEVDSHLWLPLGYLAEPCNRQRMRWGIRPITLPRYDYHGHRIWGLTLMMLDELTGLAR